MLQQSFYADFQHSVISHMIRWGSFAFRNIA